MHFQSMQDLISLAEQANVSIYSLIIEYEAEMSRRPREKVIEDMRRHWLVMSQSIAHGKINKQKSASGLVGENAGNLLTYIRDFSGGYTGAAVLKTAAYAVGVSEVNAVMGKIVACPTAGSCGILPAALYAGAERTHAEEEQIINALFTAGGAGMILAQNASISGAEGGCQAECGSASAMAAAALVELAGGTPKQVGEGSALALKNTLGLTCDPVAGLVEVPCVKRNGFYAVQAMLAADMALAGIESVIPVDEVIAAMRQIGLLLPKSLKETSEAGLADTPTAREIEKRLYEG